MKNESTLVRKLRELQFQPGEISVTEKVFRSLTQEGVSIDELKKSLQPHDLKRLKEGGFDLVSLLDYLIRNEIVCYGFEKYYPFPGYN